MVTKTNIGASQSQVLAKSKQEISNTYLFFFSPENRNLKSVTPSVYPESESKAGPGGPYRLEWESSCHSQAPAEGHWLCFGAQFQRCLTLLTWKNQWASECEQCPLFNEKKFFK